MSTQKTVATVLGVASMLLACSGGAGDRYASEWSIDQRSYTLGGIGAFSEMVGAGVKRLALSAPLEPAEMDAVYDEAERIAADHGVQAFREADFLVTELFPASLTEGKHVLVICHESTLREYLELKSLKQKLETTGQYDATARIDIARRFGQLLSYPEEKISSLLASRGEHSTP